MSVMLSMLQVLRETNASKAAIHSNATEAALRDLLTVEEEVFLGRFVYQSAIDSSAHEVCCCHVWHCIRCSIILCALSLCEVCARLCMCAAPTDDVERMLWRSRHCHLYCDLGWRVY